MPEERHRAAGARPSPGNRTGQLPGDHARMVAALFDGDWTTENTAPVVLA
ncbi:hypothetical protein ABZT16_37110 [Streptomyces flaveolus]|uniref:Uncharacterized protein n=1 Tax=Streptomyces flaveolus TaxID=67297 RepID=A0ABV3ANV8_9ACTN|nr:MULTISPECIES: hypothetical protein [Streptomyces]